MACLWPSSPRPQTCAVRVREVEANISKGEFLDLLAPGGLRLRFCCTFPHWVFSSFFSVSSMSLVLTA